MQQQALRDFAQAMRNFFNGTHRRPTWRKAGKPGFRQVAVNRATSNAEPPLWAGLDTQVGWVRFRWTRAVADTVKSYRVTLDRSGRWHIAFAPSPTPSPTR